MAHKFTEVTLSAIWWEPSPYQRSHAESYAVGPGVTRIFLVADGQGPMGWYDRVHVYLTDGEPGALRETEHLVFPAHYVHGWGIEQ